MARPISKRIKMIQNLTKVGVLMIYLGPLAWIFRSVDFFLVLVTVGGFCFWIASILSIFKEPYSRKLKIESTYQELEKLSHRRKKIYKYNFTSKRGGQF